MPDLTFTARGVSQTPARIAIQVRDFILVVDEPPALGGDDQAPNPVEFLLASFIGCLNVMAHLIAGEFGFELRHLEIEATGDLNPGRLFGAPSDDRAGYKGITVTLAVDADADAETLRRWRRTVESRCPVFDNLTQITPVRLEARPLVTV